MQRYAAIGAVLLTVAACQDATSPRPIAGPPPAVNAAQGAADGDYIVVFRNDESNPGGLADALVKSHGGQLKHVYRNALKGFAVQNLPVAAVEALRRNPRIELVEPDGIVTIDATQSPTPSWGIDRIDAALGRDNSYTYPNTASNVTAYIIDTGINSSITDLSGRILPGVDYIDGGTPEDCHGHGTHVAGTVAGTAYGVAKGAKVIAVRVLNCQGSGSTSGVIAGVDWAAGDAVARKPAVANMSLGGGFYGPLNTAVNNAVASGVSFAVAAGNSNADACGFSPASAGSAITVGATTSTDAKASYSNFGNCVDIQAPGSSITSDWVGSATATNTISGTSMASPHVAGAAALVLSANPTWTPAQVRDELVAKATNGVVTGLPSGPNKLLYIGFLNGTPPVEPPDDSPTVEARFTKSCNGFSCTFTNTSTGTITSTRWTFEDGFTSNALSFTRTDFKARTGYPFTLTVNGTVETSGTVICNPKKCQ